MFAVMRSIVVSALVSAAVDLSVVAQRALACHGLRRVAPAPAGARRDRCGPFWEQICFTHLAARQVLQFAGGVNMIVVWCHRWTS